MYNKVTVALMITMNMLLGCATPPTAELNESQVSYVGKIEVSELIPKLENLKEGMSKEQVYDTLGVKGEVMQTALGETWMYNFSKSDGSSIFIVVAFIGDEFLRYSAYSKDAD